MKIAGFVDNGYALAVSMIALMAVCAIPLSCTENAGSANLDLVALRGRPRTNASTASCITCAELIGGEKPAMVVRLCQESVPIWNDFHHCACSGACASVCNDPGDFCSSIETNSWSGSGLCIQCLQETEVGCGDFIGLCSWDEPVP